MTKTHEEAKTALYQWIDVLKKMITALEEEAFEHLSLLEAERVKIFELYRSYALDTSLKEEIAFCLYLERVLEEKCTVWQASKIPALAQHFENQKAIEDYARSVPRGEC